MFKRMVSVWLIRHRLQNYFLKTYGKKGKKISVFKTLDGDYKVGFLMPTDKMPDGHRGLVRFNAGLRMVDRPTLYDFASV